MNRHQLWSPRTLFDSTMAVRNENDSMTMARPSTTSGTYFHRLSRSPPSPWPSDSSWNLWYASYSANRPPTLNSTIATMKA